MATAQILIAAIVFMDPLILQSEKESAGMPGLGGGRFFIAHYSQFI